MKTLKDIKNEMLEAIKLQKVATYKPEPGKFEKDHPVLVHIGQGKLVHGSYVGPARTKSHHLVKMKASGEVESHAGTEVASAIGGKSWDNQ